MSEARGTTWTIVVAAGVGSRFGSDLPKQFLEVAGRRVLDWSIAAAAAVSDGVVVVLPPAGTYVDGVLPDPSTTQIVAVAGGRSRSESVRNGLAAIPATADVVMVHDAARPVASADLFRRVADAVRGGAHAVVPIVEVVDTIRHVDGQPVDRDKLQSVQTPQGFAAAALRAAHDGAPDATDDASLVAAAGGQVLTIAGEKWNIKLTEPADELVVAALLQGRVQ